MTDFFARIGGHPVVSATVRVPARGVWFADVDLEAAPELEDRVELELGEMVLVGTVIESATFGLQRKVRIAGGAGAWATLLPPKAYHNDAGVSALTVAQDAARAVGEVLGGFQASAPRIGADYVRQTGPAARVLDQVIGTAGWWVDYDGITHVGSRPPSTPDAGAYEVLEYEPRSRLALLAVDDLRAVTIGSLLGERLDAPVRVRELELLVDEEGVRVKAWCGDGEGGYTELGDALRALILQTTSQALHGVWRYRVVRMASERVELQAVRRSAGLPDILPISIMPGIPGARADLTPGVEVLVQFVEGDRAQPVVTHFAGADKPGFVPVRLTLGSTEEAPGAAREGDTVRVTIPSGTVAINVTGGVTVPAAVVLNPTAIEVDGVITSSSDLVGIA